MEFRKQLHIDRAKEGLGILGTGVNLWHVSISKEEEFKLQFQGKSELLTA